MTFLEAFKEVNYNKLIYSLNLHVGRRLGGLNSKQLQGIELIDFVSEVLRKSIDGSRTWNPEVKIEAFLFMTLDSEISNFIRKYKAHPKSADTDNEFGYLVCNTDDEKLDAVLKLKADGADNQEIEVFDCWTDGIRKPSEVAAEVGLDVEEIYLITRRLSRRLTKIQSYE